MLDSQPLETANVVEMSRFLALNLREAQDPLESLLAEAQLPDEKPEQEREVQLPLRPATLQLQQSEEQMALALQVQLDGLRDELARLRFYLKDVGEAVNGL
jgi:hypothetical protein